MCFGRESSQRTTRARTQRRHETMMATMSAPTALRVVASAPRHPQTRAASASKKTSRVVPLARQLRGDGGLRSAATRTINANNVSSSRRRLSSVTPRAFSPAAGDFSLTLPEGAAALTIVLGARVLLIGRGGASAVYVRGCHSRVSPIFFLYDVQYS